MILPNYFLADLPPEATLSPAMIEDACRTLKRNREQYLARRSTADLVRLIAEVAESWLSADYPFRKLALENGPRLTGFSAGTLSTGLDNFFRAITAENLKALLVQEFGHAQRLDSVSATIPEQLARRAGLVTGPEFLVHIAAGGIPNPAMTSIIFGILLRSAQFVKCARGSSYLVRLFAHSLYDADAKLGACLEIAEWPGGTAHLEAILFEEANCVTATGSDETLKKIRGQVPISCRFVGHGHRVSFGFVAQDSLSGFSAQKVAARAAADVVAWNQIGCLSPHVIYVEHGGGMNAEQFAELLGQQLEKREQTEPRGELPAETAAVIAAKRAFYEVRAAHSPETRHWCSANSTAWTVIYEADPRFQLSCLNRFIYVKGVTSLAEALQNADGIRGKVSTVGVAAGEERMLEIAAEAGRWGATRVCPLGQMQNPPLLWRHDGQPALAELATWTDVEL